MQVLAHNILAQYSQRELNITSGKKAKSAEKLSSGYRINRSADDAAGLQISEKMRKQVRGLNQASRNIEDGVSLCQVADGALEEVQEILQRMNELSIQAANDTNTVEDRQAIQDEMNQLRNEVVRISVGTTYNDKPVFPENTIKKYTTNTVTVPTNNPSVQIPSGSGSSVSTVPINDTSIQLPLGIEQTINAANISTMLLQNADGSYELKDGFIYTISSDVKNVTFHLDTGKTASIKNSNLEMCSVICEDATLYLSDVKIDNSTTSSARPSGYAAAPISCKGDSKVNFIGVNELTGGRYTDAVGNISDYAAFEVLYGKSVELNGNGALTCTGGRMAAGIGANYVFGQKDAGTIVINSGEIKAYSGDIAGSGIGGAYEGSGGNVIINGGSVYANGGDSGAGIGSGANLTSNHIHGGTVEINGGITYAESSGTDGGAGIGGGSHSSGAKVTITGGEVTAIGSGGGAGIGSGYFESSLYNLDSGSVTISGGKVTAVGSSSSSTGLQTVQIIKGSAIGQGAMLGNATDKQNWLNGFGTTTIDGVIVDTQTIGRDPTSFDSNGNYTYTYQSSTPPVTPPVNPPVNPPCNQTVTVGSVQEYVEEGSWWIQMGADSGDGMVVKLGSLKETKEQIENISVLSSEEADEAMESVQKAIDLVSGQRAMIGAYQNRLEHAKAIDDNTAENTQYAESRIRDTDMAKEMVEFAKNNILEQAGQSMLAQANQSTQGILSLLS